MAEDASVNMFGSDWAMVNGVLIPKKVKKNVYVIGFRPEEKGNEASFKKAKVAVG